MAGPAPLPSWLLSCILYHDLLYVYRVCVFVCVCVCVACLRACVCECVWVSAESIGWRWEVEIYRYIYVWCRTFHLQIWYLLAASLVFSCVVSESAVCVNTVYLSTLLICFSSASAPPPPSFQFPVTSQLLGRGETAKDKVNYLLPCLFLNDYVLFTVGLLT